MIQSVLRRIVRRRNETDASVAAGTRATMEFVCGVIRSDMTPKKFERWWRRFLRHLEVEELEGEILDAIREKDRQQK